MVLVGGEEKKAMLFDVRKVDSAMRSDVFSSRLFLQPFDVSSLQSEDN
jgi:hypothetical protein